MDLNSHLCCKIIFRRQSSNNTSFLNRVDVPMLVIFIGSIGGFVASGFVGLFIGAVVLSVGYELLRGWVEQRPAVESVDGSAA